MGSIFRQIGPFKAPIAPVRVGVKNSGDHWFCSSREDESSRRIHMGSMIFCAPSSVFTRKRAYVRVEKVSPKTVVAWGFVARSLLYLTQKTAPLHHVSIKSY